MIKSMSVEDLTVRILGGHESLGSGSTGLIDLHKLILRGFGHRVYQSVKYSLDATDEEMARLLGASLRKLSFSIKHRKRLSPDHSDRLYRLARVLAIARNTFNDRKLACKWLRHPQIALGDAVPIDLLVTEPGAEEVENMLGRILHGVIS